MPHCATYVEYQYIIAGTRPLCDTDVPQCAGGRQYTDGDPLLQRSRAAAALIESAAVRQASNAYSSLWVDHGRTVCDRVCALYCRRRGSQADDAASPAAAAAALREAASCGVIACKVGAGMRCPPVHTQGNARHAPFGRIRPKAAAGAAPRKILLASLRRESKSKRQRQRRKKDCSKRLRRSAATMKASLCSWCPGSAQSWRRSLRGRHASGKKQSKKQCVTRITE